jgi:hypothetical protein
VDGRASNADRPEPLIDDRPVVDLSLIDEMLRLSPDERLLLNDQLIDTILSLRQSFGILHDGEP